MKSHLEKYVKGCYYLKIVHVFDHKMILKLSVFFLLQAAPSKRSLGDRHVDMIAQSVYLIF